MDECEFKTVCNSEGGFGCGMEDKRNCGLRRTFNLLLNSPQFKKQYAKLSDVEKVLSELPVWDDDFQLEKVLNLIRRIE